MAGWEDEWAKSVDESLAASSDSLAPHKAAIAKIESGGNYRALGPVVKGDRAYGKYQVMGANVPTWTREALGYALSPQKFLQDKEAQERVFEHKFGQYLDKYGPENAASLWFSGRLAKDSKGLRDVNTSAPEYIKAYLNNLGGQKVEGSVQTLEDLDRDFEKDLMPPREQRVVEAALQVPMVAPKIDWGIPQEAASGMLANAGPKVGGALIGGAEALGDVFRGVPVRDAWKLAQEVYIPQATTQLGEAQKAARVERPGAMIAAGLTGQMVPALVGAAGANALIQGGARALGTPAIGSFLGGTGAEGVGGLGGFAARRASEATAGAIQGAAGNLLAGQSPLAGAVFGGASGPVVGASLRAITSPLRATARPEVAQAVQAYGGAVPPAAIIEQPGAKRIVGALTGRGEPEMVEEYFGKLAERIGAKPFMEARGVKGLTPEVIQDAKIAADKAFEDFAKNYKLKFDQKLGADLIATARDATNSMGIDRPDVAKAVTDAVKKIITIGKANKGEVPGDQLKRMLKTGGVIDELYKVDSNATPYAAAIKEALLDGLERTAPEGRKELQEVRRVWRDIKTLEKIPSTTTGLVNPKVVAGKFKGRSDETAQVARMGEFLPQVDASGAVKGKEPGVLEEVLKHIPGGKVAFGGGLAGAAALGAGEHGGQLLNFAIQHPGIAASLLGSGLVGAAAKRAAENYLNSPAYLRRVIENSLTPQAHGLVNPLVLAYPLASQREGAQK